MTGLDTNVLIRYIVQDEPKQAKAATRFIESNCTAEAPGRINVIVLSELTWILGRGYGYDKATIAAVLRGLLSAPELLVEEDEAVWQALKAYELDGAGFADCLLGILNHRKGASPTITFDKKAAKESFFELLK